MVLATSLALAALAGSASALAPLPNALEPPVVSGTAESGSTLSCSNGGWTLATPTRYVRVWLRGGAPIDGTSSETTNAAEPAAYTLTEADVGATNAISCRVTAYSGVDASVPAQSAPVVVGLGRPRSLAPPSISPAPAIQPAQTATCNAGSWLNSSAATRAYSWQRNGEQLATGQTYVVAAGDSGALLVCTETVTNGRGSESAQSAPVAVGGGSGPPPLPVPPANVSPPVVDGTPQSGRTVSCQPGLWLNDPTAYAYQWRRDGSAIPAATATSYAIVDADVGRALTCAVTATNVHGTSAAATSLPVYPVAAGVSIPFNQAPPTIGGTPQARQRLSCAPGSWFPSNVSYSYRWNRDGGPIAAATGSTYDVSDADVGSALTCTVTAANDFGSGRATSAAVRPTAAAGGVVKPVSLSAPALSGSALVGRTLSCTTGSWSGSPTILYVRWARDGRLIGGATAATYRLASADAGKQLGCVVVAGNSAGYGTAFSRRVSVTADRAGSADRRRPIVSRFKASPRRFVRHRGRTVFSWRLSEAARVRIVVERKLVGYRKGRRCRSVTSALRRQLLRRYRRRDNAKRLVTRDLRRHRCTRWKRAATLPAVTGKPGAGKLRFSGRSGRRVLGAGSYRAALTATDAAGNRSVVRRASLAIKSAPKRKR